MANEIKLGSLNISAFKVGSGDCTVYLGSTLLYPTFQGKWLATYSGGTTSSADCDVSSAVTQNEITLTDLVSVKLGNCVNTIDNNAFSGSTTLSAITIPNGITTIGSHAFVSCTSLTDVKIPNSVTTLGYGAFMRCSGLTSVKLSSNVSVIDANTFAFCTSLSSITIPDSVTVISGSSFNSCSSLATITIPSGVTIIGNSAFYNCSGLTEIIVEPTTPPTLGTNVFDDTNNCPIYVTDNLVSTYKSAWSEYASRIQAVPYKFIATYSNGTTYSERCKSVSSLTSATTKPSGYDYTLMTSAEVGECVTSITSDAFSGLTSLSAITFDSSVPPTIAADAFDNTNAMLYVPCASVGTFRAASNWSSYSSRIVGYESCTTYSWEVISGTYMCQEGNKYEKEKEIRSFDGGTTWEDVIPYVYRAGQLIESGSTDCVPHLPTPFTVNYNAKQYDSTTNTLPKTYGQLANVDAVISGSPTIVDNSSSGYITYNGNGSSRAIISGYQQYFNRSSDNPNLTIVAKAMCTDYPHMFANRGDQSSYNWMFRVYTDHLTLHGQQELGQIAISTNSADIFSVRVSGDTVTYNNWTSGTTTSETGFYYGSQNNDGTALFNGYTIDTAEPFSGNFYWVYMSQETLTDAQIQQVIDYNENL